MFGVCGLVLCSCFFLLPISAACANPAGGAVIGGAATISSVDGEVQIRQSTPRAVIEWKSFDIGAGETTRFIQPATRSIALNRVVNAHQASVINGNLVANGHVLVINPNGVLIGSMGHVDAAGFIASSADTGDSAFMEGRNSLSFDRSGDPGAAVENQGLITVADEGLALLVAPRVRNSGRIEGHLARVQMGAADGFGIDFFGDGLIRLEVADGVFQARTLSADNTGSLRAEGGVILMTAAEAGKVVKTVINTSGYIEAGSLISRGGRVILTGSGASVGVAGTIDVSGGNGGGVVRIGGDAQGEGALPRASVVSIGPDAVIKADAVDSGAGGSVAVWSDTATFSRGHYFARGGVLGGDGGLIETSSGGYLDVRGSAVDTSALAGRYGDWLLDPLDLVIRLGENDSLNDNNFDHAHWLDSGANGFGDFISEVYESEIEGQDTNFILRAKRNIFVSGNSPDDVVQLMGGRSLTLETENRNGFAGGIDLTGSIDGDRLLFRTTGNGAITLRASYGGSGVGDIKLSRLQTENGDVTVVTDNGNVLAVSGAILTRSGRINSPAGAPDVTPPPVDETTEQNGNPESGPAGNETPEPTQEQTDNVLPGVPAIPQVPESRILPDAHFDALGRLVLSLADNVAGGDIEFEPFRFGAVDGELSLAPADGDALQVENIEPAAGDESSTESATKDDFSCANAFLKNQRCVDQK